MADNIVDVTDATFEAEVLQSELPVLVDFWAPWCGPCRTVAPEVESVAVTLEGQAKFVKMSIDENEGVPEHFSIMSIPTFLVFKGGAVVDTIVGATSAAKIEALLRKHLGG